MESEQIKNIKKKALQRLQIKRQENILCKSIDLNVLIELLSDLNCITPAKETAEQINFNLVYERKFEEISKKIGYFQPQMLDDFKTEVTETHVPTEFSSQWKYVFLSFRLLCLIKEKLGTHVLSIEHSKQLGVCLRALSTVGIACNIVISLPYYLEVNSFKESNKNQLTRYHCLKYTFSSFYMFMLSETFRPLIISNCLQHLIVALYQLACCRLRQPSTETNQELIIENPAAFVMTEEIYHMMLSDQQRFSCILKDWSQGGIHPVIFIRENLILFQFPKVPLWFTKEIGTTLTKVLRGKDGVIKIISVLLDGFDDDSTTSWRCIDVCARLILSMRRSPEFETNICRQLFDFMKTCEFKEEKPYRAAEKICIQCTRVLYADNKQMCTRIFIPKLSENLKVFSEKTHCIDDGAIDRISMDVRLIHGCLVTSPLVEESKRINVDLVKPVIQILFRLHTYLKEVDSVRLKPLKINIKEILIEYLSECNDISATLDAFIFNIIDKDIMEFRNDIYLHPEHRNIVIKKSDHLVAYSVEHSAEILDKLVTNNPKLVVKLVCFYLSCLTHQDKYFGDKPNFDLLSFEAFVANSTYQKIINVHKYLDTYMHSKEVQDYMKKEPLYLLQFVKSLLENSVKNCVHKFGEPDNYESQSLFTVLMVLEALSLDSERDQLEQYHILQKPLKTILAETKIEELKSVIEKILQNIYGIAPGNPKQEVDKSEYEEALEDICDQLLPVKGHGLMALAKLIEKKDAIAMKNKNYALNIFQQNLKDEDSFIYLNAVRGLVALTHMFTDTVLTVLCEEYADFTKKNDDDNGLETRMKLGEVLVKVSKELGEMAPKYKALLLNTFLCGTKDDDHLIRASSLSNLGEICRVLSYRIQTVLLEVLMCVNSIIATDKSVEARRAAVTVIGQIFTGLGGETINYFKEEILPTYRLLKTIYYNDNDDVMRLQAQLALEQLDENMKQFVFPQPTLHMDKSPLVLK